MTSPEGLGGPWEPPPETPEPSPPPGEPAPPTAWERFVRRYREAPVTVTLVLLTVGFWLVHLALQHWGGINTDLTMQDDGTALHGQSWRLLTPMLVHYGTLHIGFNMLALWVVGAPVEKVIGRWQYLAAYILCGVGGDALSDVHLNTYVSHGQLVQPVAGGASGAIFGVVGLLIGNYVALAAAERWGRRSTQPWRFTASAAKSLAIQGTAWIVLTSFAIKNVDNWAHVGGAACGLLIGGAIAWSRTVPA